MPLPSVTTRTYLQIMQQAARRLGCYRSGTATAGAATTFTAANYPYLTSRADEPTRELEGVEVYWTSGTAAPSPNSVAAYAPSTGVFTVGVSHTVNPANGNTFDLYSRGVTRSILQDSVNLALRQMYYQYTFPWSQVVDGDMAATGVGDWTATTATLSKVTVAENLPRGSQALRVLATAANGQAASRQINASLATGSSYHVSAFVRADVGTARLVARDETNAVDIRTLDYSGEGWGYIEFDFDVATTVRDISIVLRSVGSSDDTYWWGVSLLRNGQRDIILPDFVTLQNQVRAVYTVRTLSSAIDGSTGSGTGAADNIQLLPVHWYHIFPDMSSTAGRLRLSWYGQTAGPLWLTVSRPYATLSADADTTLVDQEWIELATMVEVLEVLAAQPAGTDSSKWGIELEKWRKRLRRRSLELGDGQVIDINFMRPY